MARASRARHFRARDMGRGFKPSKGGRGGRGGNRNDDNAPGVRTKVRERRREAGDNGQARARAVPRGSDDAV